MEVSIQDINARVDRPYRPEARQTVSFDFDEEMLSLFDPETGDSLETKTGGVETAVGEYIHAE